MVFDAVAVSLGEAFTACLTDGFASSFMLVVGGDVADCFVQADGVVLGPNACQFGLEDGRVGDRFEVRPLAFDVPEETFDPRLIGWGARPPVVLRDSHQHHVRPGVGRCYGRPVVGHRDQDRAGWIICCEFEAFIG